VESQLSHGSTFTFTLPLFSLAKFLFSIITDQGRLRDSLSLITVELAPRFTPFTGNWEEMRQLCLQILQPCILGDKDAILPTLANAGQAEAFVVVASTDEHGARIVEKRMREQLERSESLQARCVFRVASTGLKLPLPSQPEAVVKLVEQVADSITKITLATLRQSRPSPQLSQRAPDGEQ
jgi:hypothetical protein